MSRRGRLVGSRWLGRRLGCRCRCRCRCRLGQTLARRAARSEGPRTIEFAHGLWCKEAEQPTREVQSTGRTARTLVHNLSLTSFALVINSDHLKTMGSAVVLRCVQGNNKIIVRVIFSTSAHPSIVQGKSGIVEPFLKVSRHLINAHSGAVSTSMTSFKRRLDSMDICK